MVANYTLNKLILIHS
uniref:Uncharacterized protein n=1 Tax=Anguilla anguilla TaxID=7936 RepID=A0A0E9TYL5_ANGAN